MVMPWKKVIGSRDGEDYKRRYIKELRVVGAFSVVLIGGIQLMQSD